MIDALAPGDIDILSDTKPGAIAILFWSLTASL